MRATTPVVDGPRRRVGLSVVTATLLLLPLSACALFRPAAPVPIELRMVETRVEAEQFGEIRLRGLFQVRNPNGFAVTLDAAERTLRLQDRPISSETDRVQRVIEAGGLLDLPVRLAIESSRIRDAIDRIPEDGRLAATLQLAVRADQRVLGTGEYVTAEWNGLLPLLERPRLGFRGFSVAALSPLQADYELVFDLLNPNRYAVRLMDIELDLVIDGTPFGRVEARDLDRWISAGETVTVRVDRSQRLTRDDSRLFTILQPGRRLAIEVAGRALFSFDSPFAPLPSPISASGRIDR